MRIPKYQQIKSDLQLQIESGKFENGDRFFSESELAKMYNVSSITVIRAVQELVNDGYLVRYQGKGTYISRSRKRKLVEFSDIEVFPTDSDTVTVLSIEKGQQKNYLDKLELTEEDFYYCIKRIRKTENQPYILHYSFIPERYVKADVTDLSYYNSIYQRFRVDFDIHMTEEASVETNQIIFPTPKEAAELLSMPETEPTVFQIKTTRSRNTNQPLEYVETYKKWDFYKIEFATVTNP